jgi:SH3-like domain-containing protein
MLGSLLEGPKRMRWRLLLAIMLAACAPALARATEFPYRAYVNSDDVYVRSGPGRNYYPTTKLRKGEAVEVYRHDPGGWLAIRPPRDSFAWVSKRHLDPGDDGIATVNSDRVVARVGSALGDVRDVIQVRLSKGEMVELVETPSDDSPWCKIAPPSGEFRWVFSKYVDRELPADLAEDQREAEAARGYVSHRDEGDVQLTAGEDEGEAAGARSGAADTGSPHVQRALDQVDFELSAMVAGDIAAWSFDDFQQRVEEVLKQAETPIDRGRCRLLLTNLARFADIKKRHDALRRSPEAAATAGTSSVDSRRDDPRFDGVGRLSPVISEKVGGPQFALVDSANAVISFITPAPGVNLRPYVDRYVGVNGQRGYMTDLGRQHINVQRVTLLEVERR